MSVGLRYEIAICTRNRVGMLALCLDALIACVADDVRIRVIDNGSSDDTRTMLGRYGARLDVLDEPAVGLSNARNKALAACRADYLVFLDDDGIPDPSWGPAIADIVAIGDIDVFGGPYTPFYTTPKPAWFDDDLGSAHLDLVDGYVAAPICFSGGNMGWRTSALRAIGGFDPKLGMSGTRMGLGEETSIQLKLYRNLPPAKFYFSSRMSMKHHTSEDKMTLKYIFKRNYIYGRQLQFIAPADPANLYSFARFAKTTKLFLPLLLRIMVRDRRSAPFWKEYAARYLSLNSILAGAQYERQKRRIASLGARLRLRKPPA